MNFLLHHHTVEVDIKSNSYPSPLGDCVVIASIGERQSGSKALECGSCRLWRVAACIKLNAFISLVRLNPNDQRLPPCLRRSGFAQAGPNLWEASRLSFDRPLPGKPPTILGRLSLFSENRFFHIATQPFDGRGEGAGVTAS
jgi:hypothetical protein